MHTVNESVNIPVRELTGVELEAVVGGIHDFEIGPAQGGG